MRRTQILVGLVSAAFLGSCGAGTPAFEDRGLPEAELEVRPERPEQPPLELRLRYQNSAALFGTGSLSFWARPSTDEIRVGAVVDAPARSTRWAGCREVTLYIDGAALPLAARYVGRAMDSGVYDAVLLHLGIHELRRMARARHVSGSVCGDPLELSAAQRRTLARFVTFFDRLAAPVPLEDAPLFREVGPKLELLPCEEEDPGPYPA
jgi:hypothetical protein